MKQPKSYWHVKEADLIEELESFNYYRKEDVKIPKLLHKYAFGKDIQVNELALPYYILKKLTYEQIMDKNALNKEFLIYLNQTFMLYFSNNDEVIVEVN